MAKILVIEDEPIIRESILEILEIDGYEVVAADNGRTGLMQAQESLPDLILCDIEMPEMNGYQFLSQLREDMVTVMVPVIFLTAKVTRSDIRQGMTLGADDYITKPFTVEELRQAVKSQLQKKALRHKDAQTKLDELRGSIARSLPHELNTPLNGILGITDLLLSQHGSMSSTEEVELLQILRTSATRLHRLTKNFLLYAQLELIASDPQRLADLRRERSECHARSIVEEVGHRLAERAQRESDLVLDLDESLIQLNGHDWQKIAEELIDNALKFSQPGQLVQVIGQQSRGLYQFSVLDGGQGMAPEQISNLGAYMQFERKLYEQQGCGLGLEIVRRMLELYDGKIMIESTVGQGTAVHLTIDLAPEY